MSRRGMMTASGVPKPPMLTDRILLIDAPLETNVNDISGNGNHLTKGTGGAFVTIAGEQCLSAITANGGAYSTFPINDVINSCEIHLDFNLNSYGTNTTYHNIIDSSRSGGNTGIFTQIEKGVWRIGFGGNASWYYIIPLTQTPINTWIRLVFSVKKQKLVVKIINLATGTEYVYDSIINLPVNIIGLSTDLVLGGNMYYSRYLNGYIKNFKLYTFI